MRKNGIDLLLENQNLKKEFAMRNLDATQVLWYCPETIEQENSKLRILLDWVVAYQMCGNRQAMEAQGFDAPPIEPEYSPEADWYRFELWMQGKPLRAKVKDQFPKNYKPKSGACLHDEEVSAELKKLMKLYNDIRIMVEFKDGVPDRLAYDILVEQMEKYYDLTEDGLWHFDGCVGCCPFCYQRPWCEVGTQTCWDEDEKAGKMHLIEPLHAYVSSTPDSLNILQRLHNEEQEAIDEAIANEKHTSPRTDNNDFLTNFHV